MWTPAPAANAVGFVDSAALKPPAHLLQLLHDDVGAL